MGNVYFSRAWASIWFIALHW